MFQATHKQRDVHVEEDHTREEADQDRDARGKVLRDVVRVVDHKRDQYAASGLHQHVRPHN